MKKHPTTDTICALSSPPGMGAIALVRISGPKSVSIAQQLFSADIASLPSHRVVHGWIRNEKEQVDEVLLSVLRAPATFTGEDTVEITCHGSLYIQQRIIDELLGAGCRMADPGEFSLRAFLNGKMDLSQAEAIGDLIASESAAAHRQAMHQMRGGFSKEIHSLRDRLIHFASMIELELDFAEEDVEFADRTQLIQLLNEILKVVEHLRDSFQLGNALKNGVPVAILGAPNMGKSTLLNALLNEDRAIVSDIPGTTRDTVEDQVNIGGIRFRFIDTAGIRASDDTIESLGIGRSFASARNAQVVLYLFDATSTSPDELKTQLDKIHHEAGRDKNVLLVANKIDLEIFDAKEFAARFADFNSIVPISARQKTGLDTLKNILLKEVEADRLQSGETIVTNSRHHHALVQASLSLHHVMTGIDHNLSSDLLSVDLRKAIYHLSEITGQINSDDLLANIFSKFCIGK